MQSKQWPDLPWVPARSFGAGRPQLIRLIVIHTTEGHEEAGAARDGAHYDAVRTDGTSAHYFVDPSAVVQCVLTTDRAYSARAHGNNIGIHYELCGTAHQSGPQWADADSQAIIHRAAKQAARDAKKYNIPIRRLTSAEVRNGALGFCGHNEITLAFPEDGGTHWDPGTGFPWAQFLSLVELYANGDEEDVTPDDIAKISSAVWGAGFGAGDSRETAGDRLARAAHSGTTVVLAPDQLVTLADMVAARLAGGFELAFRKATP